MMKYDIEVYKFPDPAVVIRNWYTESELQQIWQELDVICSPFILSESHATSAKNADGVILKKGVSVFLDSLYQRDRSVSNILSIGRKLYDIDLTEQLIDIDHSFKHIINCNLDHTLLNYYENKCGYALHKDNSCFTANIVLWREPKMFDGGRFVVTEKEVDLNINSNDIVIFPGYLPHAATTIEMHDNYIPWKSGRISIANFIQYKNG